MISNVKRSETELSSKRFGRLTFNETTTWMGSRTLGVCQYVPLC